jgi:hypothetical protein
MRIGGYNVVLVGGALITCRLCVHIQNDIRNLTLFTTLTPTGPCIVIYSCNKSQRDALFLGFIFGIELNMFGTGLLSIIRSLNTVYTARDALFLKFILIKNSTCFGHTYCPSSGVSTLYTQQEIHYFSALFLE